MMLALGFFVFRQQTLPYQSLNRSNAFSWQANSRVGKRSTYQYLGPGDGTIDITGDLYPELTGGQLSLLAVRKMAELGTPWPLISAGGMILGMYVITSVTENGTLFHSDGTPRKISFTLKLTEVDPTQSAFYNEQIKTGTKWLQNAKDMLGIGKW